MFKNTTSGMNEDSPFPIETVEVNDAEMAQLALDYIAANDKTPYVVNNVQDPDNKTYYEWTGTKWVPWNDLNQGNRWCIPANQVQTHALTADIGDMGGTGQYIDFNDDKDTIGMLRLVPDANNWDITGLVAPSAACKHKQLIVMNIGTYSIRFRSNNGGSAAENRFLFANPTEIVNGDTTVVFIYDTVDQRWKIKSRF